MRYLTFILIVFLLDSCKHDSNIKAGSEVSKDLKNFELDSILSIDSNNLILNINIDSFLIKPFDLLTFKLKKNGSLSSGANFKDYHFKPDFEGVGYCFFMFEPKNTNIIIDGKEIKHSKVGYLGRDKANLAILEDGLKIKTFQPNDEFKNNYLNPNEVLIELIAKYNDFDLPELSFVGLDSISITKQLGKQTFYKNNCIVYTKNNKALILKLNNKKVEWLRYIVLAEKLEFEADNFNIYNVD